MERWVAVEEFLRLVDYELRSSARWRRFASVLVIGANSHGKGIRKFRMLIEEVMRSSDEMTELAGGRLALLMPETSKEDALHAVARYRKRYDPCLDVRYGVASYPGDCRTAMVLLDKACSRLDTAWDGDTGAVVTVDKH